jgi:predicted RNA-binding protein (TIGR00451 family)
VADYQFESSVGEKLFPDDVVFSYSRATGRLRHLYLHDELVATLRPTDGMLSLALQGARRLAEAIPAPRLRVIIREDVAPYVSGGSDVFAKHVLGADPALRSDEETIVTVPSGEVIAVGKALLTGKEMLGFKRGVAVRVRKGVDET